MTVLVASASKHGATQEIAQAIAAVLEAEGIPVVLRPQVTSTWATTIAGALNAQPVV